MNSTAPDSDQLLQDLLELSLTGIILFEPIYASHEPATIIDLAYVRLNPAAQRMLLLPERPTATFLTLYPNAEGAGIFAFYRDTFLAGQPGHYDMYYQHDGLDNYFRLAARRSGNQLLVSFTDTGDQPRTPVEEALRQAQVQLLLLQTAAEDQRRQLQEVFHQAPVAIALLEGPTYHITLANPSMCEIWARTQEQVLDRPLLLALPELQGQGIQELLDGVLRTGQPYVGTELGVQLRRHGQLETIYFNFVYQPQHDAQGTISGILVVATDVTQQVLARLQVQDLNQELTATNEEIQAANAEYLVSNAELTRTQQQLRQLNDTLRQAQAEAEAQRNNLQRLFMQAPAAICILSGPELTYELVNPGYEHLFAHRQLLGQPLLEALPELAGHAIVDTLRRVYATGGTHIDQHVLVRLARTEGGPLEDFYFNYIFQARMAADGHIDGVLVFAFDVSEHVQVQRRIEQLNQELEARVQERTEQLHAALGKTERQRAQLQTQQQALRQILGQVPASIATLNGAEHRYGFFNDAYQNLVGGRAQLGQPVAQVLPEVAAQGFTRLLDQVYQTGQAFTGTEMPLRLTDPASGQAPLRYIDFIYQPLLDEQGGSQGILAFILDVTDKVLARQRAELLKGEVLAATRRQAQERETFYQVFEQTPALIQLLRTPDHHIEYVNPAYQRLFPDRRLVGLDLAEAIPEAEALGLRAVLDTVYQTGETFVGAEMPLSWAGEAGQPDRSGYFNFTYQAYRENGQIAGISVFAYDVTEQVLARLQREAERERLQRLFMEAPAAICILAGPELVFELVNPAYQRLLPDRPLLGRRFLEAMPELAQHSVMAVFREIYETGITHEESAILVPLTGPDGELEDRYFNYIQQARRDEQGHIDGVLVFAFEVTEQVRARRASEASAQQLRLLTDALPVLIGYLDHEYKYRFANQAYEAWFDQKPEELLGRHVRAVVGEQAFENARPYIERALAGERLDFEARMPYRAGFTKYIRTSYIPDVRQGAVVGFYTLVSDVTEQVEARQRAETSAQQALALAQELHTTNEQLTRTNVDLDNFIYTASHDLKAPITNIEGLVEMLQRELRPAAEEGEVAYILDLMHHSVDRFKRTIEHLTAVSRLQKEHDPPVTQVQLAAVIEDVRLDLAPLLRQTNGHFDVDVRNCPPLLFSEKNLRSVVYNLLSNALKYHHPDRPPRIRVRTRLEEAFVVLEVHDNGLGINLRQQEQVFAMFQRLHTHVEGSGIGLYMVRRMLENVGGRITLASELGVGSTFSAYFPR
ncbi:PAS domain S-box protein [Hymenobacter aquaticus]|uniref:histidine kinase n=1 Tax=Hymenobacter aquaticus TaxID=1867101 RepID=A0A4Z0Q3T0_9BACT|nr:PAS domain-containing protein [Hymenobacter aquaticus]TGE24707.1 PAS domain S-box protein [Hymenobacter aquaticus]